MYVASLKKCLCHETININMNYLIYNFSGLLHETGVHFIFVLTFLAQQNPAHPVVLIVCLCLFVFIGFTHGMAFHKVFKNI